MATKTYSKLVSGLRQAKSRFRFLGEDVGIGIANKNFTKKMADELIKNININYGFFLSRADALGDMQYRDDYDCYAVQEANGYEIRIVGSQVIYDEFGTGDEGLANPHPNKSKFGLRPYNSGKYIRRNRQTNRKYWTFISPVDWEIAYSSGVPSGQFVFKGLMQTADELHFFAGELMDEIRKSAMKKSVKEEQITMEFLADELGIEVD